MIKNLACLSAIAALLSACMAPLDQPGPAFGESVKRNSAVQIVNPSAPADKSPIAMNGERAALAAQKYVLGQTKPLEATVTSRVEAGANK